MFIKIKTDKERFYEKVILPDDNGCMLWRASTFKFGHGLIKINNKNVGAHRFSYELHNGLINNKNLFVCHTCDVPSCVAPNHLYLGTAKDNTKDRYLRHRDWQSNRKNCPSGHLYNSINTGIRQSGISKGQRYCKECSRIRSKLKRKATKYAISN